ncbi:uncharacterized protein LOC118008187 isoform X2 [Mirounga leonina]|uniref:uncharacterized protein LOC118008187 isoform X2 n=1 Tax=Mirounga leonina TaxID=9715 RepID=UPI00156C4FD1|nr:uncharacterized protein LOC118008187 isoform X2 [Mirounga leonina]
MTSTPFFSLTKEVCNLSAAFGPLGQHSGLTQLSASASVDVRDPGDRDLLLPLQMRKIQVDGYCLHHIDGKKENGPSQKI